MAGKEALGMDTVKGINEWRIEMKPIRLVGLLVVLLMWPASLLASTQTKGNSSTPTSAKKHPAASKRTKAQKIALAMSAGPATIARAATIITCGSASCADMNEMSNGLTKQLRAGTNGWVCYAFRDEPMCLDKQWQRWIDALMSKSVPKIEQTGIAYMLRGDKGGSNIDPYATEPTAENQWVVS